MLQRATDKVASKCTNAKIIIAVRNTKVLHAKKQPEDINVNMLGSSPLENVIELIMMMKLTYEVCTLTMEALALN